MRYIYVVALGQRYSKIGVAADPELRLKILQIGSPFRLQLFGKVLVEDDYFAGKIEKNIHRKLRRKAIIGEWFRMRPPEALLEVEMAVDASRHLIKPRAGGTFKIGDDIGNGQPRRVLDRPYVYRPRPHLRGPRKKAI